MFKQNMDGVTAESGEFGLIPEGEYKVVVSKAYETLTKSTGKPMVKVTFRILEGECSGKPIFDQIVFVEKMKGRNKHVLKVLGQPCEGDFSVNADDWIGAECIVRIWHDWYLNKKRAKVSQYKYLEEPEETEKKEEPEKERIELGEKGEEDEPLPF